MNFYEWMMDKYAQKNTPRGDLAGDMARDKSFPKDGSRTDILGHLESRRAAEACVACFKRCWRDYVREV